MARTSPGSPPPVVSRPLQGDEDWWRLRRLLVEIVPLAPPGFCWDVRRLDGSRFYHPDPPRNPRWQTLTRLWETVEGRLVAAVNQEGRGDAHLQVHPDFRHLEEEMVAWAEENLAGPAEEGNRRELELVVFEHDERRRELLERRGYRKTSDWGVTRRLRLGHLPPAPPPGRGLPPADDASRRAPGPRADRQPPQRGLRPYLPHGRGIRGLHPHGAVVRRRPRPRGRRSRRELRRLRRHRLRRRQPARHRRARLHASRPPPQRSRAGIDPGRADPSRGPRSCRCHRRHRLQGGRECALRRARSHGDVQGRAPGGRSSDFVRQARVATIAPMSNHRLVYSTDDGDHRRDRRDRRAPAAKGPALPQDGVVRVFREKGGRGGKTVTVVRGLNGDLAAVARDLKRHCGDGRLGQGRRGRDPGRPPREGRRPPAGVGLPGQARRRLTGVNRARERRAAPLPAPAPRSRSPARRPRP